MRRRHPLPSLLLPPLSAPGAWAAHYRDAKLAQARDAIERAYGVPEPLTRQATPDEAPPMQKIPVTIPCEYADGLGHPVQCVLSIPAAWEIVGAPYGGDLHGIKLRPRRVPADETTILPTVKVVQNVAEKMPDAVPYHGGAAAALRDPYAGRCEMANSSGNPVERRIHVSGLGPVILTDDTELVATCVDGEVHATVRPARR